MSIQEQLALEIQQLTDSEAAEALKYVSFLKFRHIASTVPEVDEASLAALYQEASAEDRDLAEAGLVDYRDQLLKEDAHGG